VHLQPLGHLSVDACVDRHENAGIQHSLITSLLRAARTPLRHKARATKFGVFSLRQNYHSVCRFSRNRMPLSGDTFACSATRAHQWLIFNYGVSINLTLAGTDNGPFMLAILPCHSTPSQSVPHMLRIYTFLWPAVPISDRIQMNHWMAFRLLKFVFRTIRNF
jgi:hypothetical protein